MSSVTATRLLSSLRFPTFMPFDEVIGNKRSGSGAVEVGCRVSVTVGVGCGGTLTIGVGCGGTLTIGNGCSVSRTTGDKSSRSENTRNVPGTVVNGHSGYETI